MLNLVLGRILRLCWSALGKATTGTPRIVPGIYIFLLSINNCQGILVKGIVLLLYVKSEHVAHASRKIGISMIKIEILVLEKLFYFFRIIQLFLRQFHNTGIKRRRKIIYCLCFQPFNSVPNTIMD